MTRIQRILLAALIVLTGAAGSTAAGEPESKRLARAKDFMTDEQWTRAIEVLRQAVADTSEPSRDESLYWLAHSFNESGDHSAALQTLKRLETEFPRSLWVRQGAALRILMAVRMHRDDVLWYTATPPTPPAPPGAPVPRAPRAPHGTAPPAPPAPPQPPHATSPPAPPVPPPAAVPPRPPAPPAPPPLWLPEAALLDEDLRIQALGSLLHRDAAKVIPMLGEIALDSDNPAQASRAVFLLAQSGRPEAQATVIRVARSGSEPVRIAAVRELGRFGGPEISAELLEVYSVSQMAVKWQVVKSLGERHERTALANIVRDETNVELRSRAIVTLGQIGGREQLRVLYARADKPLKRPIIVGLFNARAEQELIQLADRERDPAIRREILTHLRMLGTPRALEYLKTAGERR